MSVGWSAGMSLMGTGSFQSILLNGGIWFGLVMGVFSAIFLQSTSIKKRCKDKELFFSKINKEMATINYFEKSRNNDIAIYKISSVLPKPFQEIVVEIYDDYCIITAPNSVIKKLNI